MPDPAPQAMTPEELAVTRRIAEAVGADHTMSRLLATVAARDTKIKLLLQDCGSVWKSLYNELSATSRAERDALKAEVANLMDTYSRKDGLPVVAQYPARVTVHFITADDAARFVLALAALTPAKETEHG